MLICILLIGVLNIFYFSVEDIVGHIEDPNDPLQVDDRNVDKDYEQGDEVDDETTMEEEEALPELEDPLREIRYLEEVLKITLL